MDEAYSAGSPPEVPDLPARDEAAGLAAAGEDPDLAQELFATLMADLPREIAEIRSYVAERHWDQVVQIAHRLRGAAGYCGVPQLDYALQELERVAKTGEGSTIGMWFRAVADAADRLCEITG